MKKLIFIFILLLIPLFITGCGTSEAKSACKNKLIETYAKANDSTITKCVADYDSKEKRVVYNFCINASETLYSLNSNNTLTTVNKDDSGYYSIATIYKQVEMETLEEGDRYLAFEFKGSELK